MAFLWRNLWLLLFGFPAVLYFFSPSISSVFSFLGCRIQISRQRSQAAEAKPVLHNKAEGTKKNNSSPVSGSWCKLQPLQFSPFINGVRIVSNRRCRVVCFPNGNSLSQTTTIPPHNHNHTTTRRGPRLSRPSHKTTQTTPPLRRAQFRPMKNYRARVAGLSTVRDLIILLFLAASLLASPVFSTTYQGVYPLATLTPSSSSTLKSVPSPRHVHCPHRVLRYPHSRGCVGQCLSTTMAGTI